MNLFVCVRRRFICLCEKERERGSSSEVGAGTGASQAELWANTGGVIGRARPWQTVPGTVYGFRAHSNLRKTQTSGSVCVLKTKTHRIMGEKDFRRLKTKKELENQFQYSEILMLQRTKTFWTMLYFQLCGKALFCSTMTVTQCAKQGPWLDEFCVEELDWPRQSPDLNLIKHLWNELKQRLQARPSCTTSVPDLTNALLDEWA